MPDPICPKCKEAMASLGRTTCPGCGTSWHWNKHAGTLRELGNTFSLAQAQALVTGLQWARWQAIVQRSI